MEEAQQIVSNLHQEVQFPQREDVKVSLESKTRRGFPYYTKYELTLVISSRIQQLQTGSPPLVSLENMDTESPTFLFELAKLEIKERKVPFIIGRHYPDGTVEYWSAMELQILV